MSSRTSPVSRNLREYDLSFQTPAISLLMVSVEIEWCGYIRTERRDQSRANPDPDWNVHRSIANHPRAREKGTHGCWKSPYNPTQELEIKESRILRRRGQI